MNVGRFLGVSLVVVGLWAVRLALVPAQRRRSMGAARPSIQYAWGTILLTAGAVVFVLNPDI